MKSVTYCIGQWMQKKEELNLMFSCGDEVFEVHDFSFIWWLRIILIDKVFLVSQWIYLFYWLRHLTTPYKTCFVYWLCAITMSKNWHCEKHCHTTLPYVLPHWTPSPHWDGPSPRVDVGCLSDVSYPCASEPVSSASSLQPRHGLLHPQIHHEQLALSSPPVLTPNHGPARPLSGESA